MPSERQSWNPLRWRSTEYVACTDPTLDSNEGQSQKQQRNEQEHRFRWIKYAVVFWSIRLCFSSIGSFVTVLDGIKEFYFPSHRPIQYTTALSEYKWDDLLATAVRKRQESVPFFVTGIPAIRTEAVHQVVKQLLVHNNNGIENYHKHLIKVSNNSVFKHFSAEQPWSEKYKIRPEHYVSTLDNLSELWGCGSYRHSLLDDLRINSSECATPTITEINECVARDSCSSKADDKVLEKGKAKYFYMSVGSMTSQISMLSPALQYLVSTSISEDDLPSYSLWLGSGESTAALHYDMEDNYLLQLTGSKTVYLLPPEAFDAVQPFPSFHPMWRQTQWKNFTSPIDLFSTIQHYSSSNEHAKRYRKSHDSIKIWEVTLTVGSMVYIPAGFFHMVTSHLDSTSVNAWTTSVISSKYKAISNLQLPFASTDSLGTKLANTGAMVYGTLDLLRFPLPVFKEKIIQRYHDLYTDQVFQCINENSLTLCSENTITLAG